MSDNDSEIEQTKTKQNVQRQTAELIILLLRYTKVLKCLQKLLLTNI